MASKKCFIILLAGFLALCLVFPAQAQEIRLGMGKAFTAPALNVGKVKGYFREEGLKVKWVNIPKPATILQAMIAGEVDAGVTTTPPFLRGVERGLDFVGVTLVAGRFRPMSTYLVRPDSGINRVEDLRGKTIGVHEYGGIFDIYLRSHLEKHGLDPKKDVRIVEVPFFTIIQALLAKTIDSGAVDTLFAKLAEVKYRGKIKALFSYSDIEEVKAGKNTMILIMRKKFIRENRELVKKFLKAYLRAIKFTIDKPQDALKLWAGAAGTPIVTRLDEFELPADGKIDIPSVRTDIELSRRYGYLKADLKAEDLIDNSLLDEVRGRR